MTTDQKATLAQQVDNLAVSWEERYSDAARAALERDRRAILARLNAAKSLFLQRKQSIDWQIVERDWKDYFENEAPEKWRDEFFPLLIGVTRDANDLWTTELGLQFNVQNLVEQAALEYQAYSMRFSEPILETTQDDLFQLLKTASQEGWTIEQMNNAIRVTWDKYLDPEMELTDEQREWFEVRTPQYRIERIARTETIRSANFGSMNLFQAYGAERHEWVAVDDNRTRDSHRKKPPNGEVVVIGTPFHVGDDLMLYPGDGSLGAGPEEIVNCRCTTVPVIEDEGE